MAHSTFYALMQEASALVGRHGRITYVQDLWRFDAKAEPTKQDPETWTVRIDWTDDEPGARTVYGKGATGEFALADAVARLREVIPSKGAVVPYP